MESLIVGCLTLTILIRFDPPLRKYLQSNCALTYLRCAEWYSSRGWQGVSDSELVMQEWSHFMITATFSLYFFRDNLPLSSIEPKSSCLFYGGMKLSATQFYFVKKLGNEGVRWSWEKLARIRQKERAKNGLESLPPWPFQLDKVCSVLLHSVQHQADVWSRLPPWNFAACGDSSILRGRKRAWSWQLDRSFWGLGCSRESELQEEDPTGSFRAVWGCLWMGSTTQFGQGQVERVRLLVPWKICRWSNALVGIFKVPVLVVFQWNCSANGRPSPRASRSWNCNCQSTQGVPLYSTCILDAKYPSSDCLAFWSPSQSSCLQSLLVGQQLCRPHS